MIPRGTHSSARAATEGLSGFTTSDPVVERRILDAFAAVCAGTAPPPRVQPRLAAAALLRERGWPDSPGAFRALAETLAGAIAVYPLDDEAWDRIRIDELLAYAESNLAYEERILEREAESPLIRNRDAVLAEARAAQATWDWLPDSEPDRVARIALGRLTFDVRFMRPSSTRPEWHQGWGGSQGTDLFLHHLQRLGARGAPVRTGLFPVLDAAIGEITRAFIASEDPDSLRVDGLDATRNRHNLATYGAHAPEGYDLEPILDPSCDRATPGGVSGVRFVRLPDPVPAPR